MTFTPIGIIHTPFTSLEGMPIQPAGAAGIRGTVEVRADLAEGLDDLDGFSHVILLYHFHRSEGYKLKVVPFMDTEPRGVFATRAPRRPNAIGLSVVRLEWVEGNILHVEGIDVLDGTPLLDIKPFVPAFDVDGTVVRTGWIDGQGKVPGEQRADDRFV